jgi:hypothetical protein
MEGNIFAGVFIFFGVAILYLMFVMVPTVFYAEAKCLRNGYPKAHVTIGLEIYCSTLDGAVTVKVDQPK